MRTVDCEQVALVRFVGVGVPEVKVVVVNGVWPTLFT